MLYEKKKLGTVNLEIEERVPFSLKKIVKDGMVISLNKHRSSCLKFFSAKTG